MAPDGDSAQRIEVTAMMMFPIKKSVSCL